MYTDFKETTDGNLLISLNQRGKEEIEDLREKFKTFSYESFWWDLNEGQFTNGYHEVRPEQIGALTSAPIISDTFFDEVTTESEMENAKIWWFPDYQIRSEIEELLNNQKVLFIGTYNKTQS